MARTTLTPTTLVLNTASADSADADGITATTQADGWALTLGAKQVFHKTTVHLLDDGSGATITVKAGANPPAHLKSLGDLTFTLAASDVKRIVLESARFQQADGTITIISSDAGTKAQAWCAPDAIAGGSGVS